MPAGPNRREVLAAGGAALGWFLIGGSRVWATPADAASAGFSPQVLSKEQVQALESIGEALQFFGFLATLSHSSLVAGSCLSSVFCPPSLRSNLKKSCTL